MVRAQTETPRAFIPDETAKMNAWKELLLRESSFYELRPAQGKVKLKQPWEKKRAKPTLKFSQAPRIVKIFQSKLVEKARQKMHSTPHPTVQKCLRAMLSEIDKDGDGKINYSEFYACIRQLGLDFRLDEQQQLFRWYDADNSGTVTYDELLKQADLVDHLTAPWPSSLSARGVKAKSRPSQAVVRFQQLMMKRAKARSSATGTKVAVELKKMFVEFDEDGNGRLQRQELSKAIEDLTGSRYGDKELDQVMAWYDSDHRGTASCVELAREADNKTIITTYRKNIITGQFGDSTGRQKKDLGKNVVGAPLRQVGRTPKLLSALQHSSSSSALQVARPFLQKSHSQPNDVGRHISARSSKGQLLPSTREALLHEKLQISNKLLKLKIKMQRAKLHASRSK